MVGSTFSSFLSQGGEMIGSNTKNKKLGGFLSGLGEGLKSGNPVGAILGAGFGLMKGAAAESAQEREERRIEMAERTARNQADTAKLRNQWEQSMTEYRLPAVAHGGTVPVSAMVAPGEVVVTNSGKVVHIKGKGNKDTVAWAGGPAMVFGNLKRPGTNTTYKEFAKSVFKETKENTDEPEGNVKARLNAAKLLKNEQKITQMIENKYPKQVRVPGKIKAKNIATVPAATGGADTEEDSGNIITVRRQRNPDPQQGNTDGQQQGNTDETGTEYKMGFWDYALPIAGTLTQAIPAIYNLSKSRSYDTVSPIYNPFYEEGLNQFKNTYDLQGALDDANSVLNTVLQDISAHGNSSGISSHLRTLAHVNQLKNRRKIFKDYALAQNAVNAERAKFMYKEGAARVQADKYAAEQTARNKGAAQNMESQGYSQLSSVFGNLFNLIGNLGSDKKKLDILNKTYGKSGNQTSQTTTQPTTTTTTLPQDELGPEGGWYY